MPLDEKRKVEVSEAEFVTLKFGNSDVLAKTYLSADEQRILIGVYLAELGTHYDFRRAEDSLIMVIIDMTTDIMLIENGIALITIDTINANYDFWNNLTKSILNYKTFRRILNEVVEEKMEQRRLQATLGETLKLLYAKVSVFLDELAEQDMSEEKLNSIRGLVKEIQDSNILRALASTRSTLNV